jgi:hypothetical protein
MLLFLTIIGNSIPAQATILEQLGPGDDVQEQDGPLDVSNGSPLQFEESISIDEHDLTTIFDNEGVSPAANDALKAIRDAQLAGADVSLLVEQFNLAMGLLHQAEQSDFTSCASIDVCVNAANVLFASIEKDSYNLGEESKKSLYEQMLISEVYAIVTAFGMSLGLLYIYKQYKSYQLRKFLDAEVIVSS